MKILKLLNKKYFLIIIILLLGLNAQAEDNPVDIWNIEEEKIKTTSEKTSSTQIEKNKTEKEVSIYEMQSQNPTNVINLDQNINSQSIKIVGLYDPEDYGLNINMWANSDGDQLKNILSKLSKINLSKDANEIVQIALFTNSYYPEKNIKEKEFLKFKSDWLIKNSDFDLIEEYLIKNQIINVHSNLSRYLVDYYLSNAELEKSCNFFEKNSEPITDKYLSKFEIYCLIHKGKKDEAQILFDLKKELGFKDIYFEKKNK